MKKIFLLSAFAALAFASCKKRVGTESQVVTASYPTVSIQSGQYFSFPVGGGPLPDANNIVATAFDSFYQQSLTPVVDASLLNNLSAGLYVATVSAKNKYGYVGYSDIYVAITPVSDTLDISGVYHVKTSSSTVDTFRAAIVTKVGRGMFRTSNVFGADTGKDKKHVIPAVFAITSTGSIDFGMQRIGGSTFMSSGVLTAQNGILDLAPPDTAFGYSPLLNGVGAQPLMFQKK